MPVTARLPLQNFLGQERFTPERDQAFRVKVFGVDGPEAHDWQLPLFNGADGGGRTHTLSRVLDFESSASANSATSATKNSQIVCETQTVRYIKNSGQRKHR